MLLISHIIIALSSVVISGVLLFAPSSLKLKLSYLATGATIATGTVLVINSGTHILQSCIMGLMIVGFSTFCALTAKKVLNQEI